MQKPVDLRDHWSVLLRVLKISKLIFETPNCLATFTFQLCYTMLCHFEHFNPALIGSPAQPISMLIISMLLISMLITE